MNIIFLTGLIFVPFLLLGVVNIPSFADGFLGVLAMISSVGDRVSLMRWRYFIPEQKKPMNNYALTPQSIVNANNPYVQIAGGWDTANPPHKAPYQFVYSGLAIIYLGVTATAGFLGTFKVTSEEHGHAMMDGADFAFNADQQGLITRTPA